MKRILVWTHFDLDGLASCLAIKWYNPDCEFEYCTTTAFNFREQFTKWLLHNNLDNYDKVYIADLDVCDDSDLIDRDNVIVIDHHSTHVDNAEYKKAKTYLVEYTSAAKLIYKTLSKETDIKLTKQQKTLIVLADDYDSYNREVPQSSMLNAIFFATQNKFSVFMELYKDGFTGFTQQQLSIYQLFKQELKQTLNSLSYFENKKIKIGDNLYHIIATFASKHINEVADFILTEYAPDIAIVVNTKSNHVSFRKHEDTHFNVSLLAEKLTDGGGHVYAAGGQITDKFLAFTKLLKPRKRMRKIEKS